MGVGRGKSCTSPETVPVTPPPPVHDYNVTGVITPDATCNYDLGGTHNGQPYYVREDSAYYIFWNIFASQYNIGSELDDGLLDRWERADTITGVYEPMGAYDGLPVVAAGGH